MIKKFLSFIKIYKRQPRKTIQDHKQELLLKYGREQFKMLVRKGLSVPVALL